MKRRRKRTQKSPAPAATETAQQQPKHVGDKPPETDNRAPPRSAPTPPTFPELGREVCAIRAALEPLQKEQRHTLIKLKGIPDLRKEHTYHRGIIDNVLRVSS